MKNNKGFAVSGILYTILVLFLVLMLGILQNLQNKKTILDNLKTETVKAIEFNNLKQIEYRFQATHINQYLNFNVSELGFKTITINYDYSYSKNNGIGHILVYGANSINDTSGVLLGDVILPVDSTTTTSPDYTFNISNYNYVLIYLNPGNYNHLVKGYMVMK